MAEGKSSSQSYIPAIIIALLAAYGVGGSSLSSKPPAEEGSTNSALALQKLVTNESEQEYPHSAAGLLENYFGTFPIKTDPDRPWLIDTSSAPSRSRCKRHHPCNDNCKASPTGALPSAAMTNARVRFLVATLPGPASPALRSEFDNGLDAIISAADDQGYTLDRFDLPWGEAAEGKTENAEPPELDIYRTKESQQNSESGKPAYQLKTEKESPPRSKTQPGVLLFRPTDNPSIEETDDSSKTKPLLIVFLVGETPTHGLNKTAMMDALDQIAWFWGMSDGRTKAAPDPQKLPNMRSDSRALNIIGPYFSGSALSMRYETQIWKEQLSAKVGGDPVNVNYFDGSATGIEAVDFINSRDACLMESTATLGFLWFGGSTWLTGYMNMRGFPDPQRASTKALEIFSSPFTSMCLIEPLGDEFSMPDKERWKIIKDDLVKNSTDNDPNPKIALLSEESAYGANDPCRDLGGCSKSDPFEIIPYPLQISDLRTAFAKERLSQPISGPAMGPQDVPESDEGSEERDDVPPNFSTRSASYDQIMLEGLLTQIRRQKTPYVGIMSSDVADLIFLAGQVRSADPDATLFTLSADSRVLRQAINPDMYGMVVFSTYPLFPGYDRWEKNLPEYPKWLSAIDPGYSSSHRMREFPSESAEAIYNATREAIYNTTRSAVEAVASPVITAIAPQPYILWKSVVGYNQFWPIDVQPDKDFFGNGVSVSPPAAEYPLSLILFYVIVSLICGGAAVMYLIPQLRPTWIDHFISSIDAPGFPETTTQKPLYVAIFFIGLFTGFVVITRYFYLPLSWTHQEPSDYSSVPLLLTYFGLLLTLPLLVALYISLLKILGPIFDWSEEIVVPYIIILILVMFWIRATCIQPWNSLGFLFSAFFQKAVFLILIASATMVIIRALIAFCQKLAFREFLASLQLTTAWLPLLLFTHYVLPERRCPYYFSNTSLLFFRSASLSNGVSHLRVFLLLGIAAGALGLCHLRRISMFEDAALPENGFLGFEGLSFNGISAAESKIRNTLIGPSLGYSQGLPGGWLLLAFIIVQTTLYAYKGWWFRYSLDGWRFNLFWVVTATITYGGLFFLLLRFLAAWYELHRLLKRLSMHPTRGCYGAMRKNRLPEEPDLRLRLLKPARDMSSAEYCLERARELERLAQQARNGWKRILGHEDDLVGKINDSKLPASINQCETALNTFLDPEEKPPSQKSKQFEWKEAAKKDLELQLKIKSLSGTITEIFERFWRSGSSEPPEGVVGDSDEHKLVIQAEYFIASRVLDYLRRVYPQMQNLVGFAMAGILAQVLACSAYPFPASNTLLTLAWIALLVGAGVSIYVFVQMNRNSIISLLQGTSPDHLSFTGSFAFQLLFVGFLPILTMLGAQFPHSFGAIFSWAGGIFSHSSGA